jgi:putative DNA primase/helicase
LAIGGVLMNAWKRGAVRSTCKQLFDQWIAARGTSGPIEIENAIVQIKRIIERDGPTRFTPWDSPAFSQ